MKKIAIIGTAGLPARYGGFETLAEHLSEYLNQRHEVHVYCSKKLYKKEERISTYKECTLHYLPLDANGWQSIPYDIFSILHALWYADVLIILGVSGCILLPFIKLFTRKKIIVNIDGLEWKRNKWNFFIKRYLKFSEHLAVRFSDADITDNQAIKEYTSEEYQSNSILIEYGADHVSRERVTKETLIQYPFLSKPYFFTVCRIEPENNLHIILEAFKNTDKNVVIVGNWNHGDYGKKLKKEYSEYNNIYLLDPIYEPTLLNILRSNCYWYIHGHSAGGTNPSLVEAMYLNLPIVAFDVCYNRATTENQAIYFSNSNHLRELIPQLEYPISINTGNKMGEIAQRRYRWSTICAHYEHLCLSFDYKFQRSLAFPKSNLLSKTDLLKLQVAHLKTH